MPFSVLALPRFPVPSIQLLSPYRIAMYSVVDPIVSHFVPFILMCIFSMLTLKGWLLPQSFANFPTLVIDFPSPKRYKSDSQQLVLLNEKLGHLNQKD